MAVDAVGTEAAGTTNGAIGTGTQCIPNGGPHDAWSAGWNHPYSDWRGLSGGWGNP